MFAVLAGAAAYNFIAVAPQGCRERCAAVGVLPSTRLPTGYLGVLPSTRLPTAYRAGGRSAPAVSFEKTEEADPGEVAGLRVLKYPHPLLRTENAEIEKFDYQLKQLTKRMFKLMYASRGVGLAAPQVGVNQRLMVVNWEGDPGMSGAELVLCNPSILETSSATAVEPEGCLSFPGFTADVARAESIVVEFQTVKGKPRRLELDGWEARVFQHEYDHLDGKLYATDRLSEAERARVEPELARLVDSYDDDAAPVEPPRPRGGAVQMSATATASNDKWFAAMQEATGIYSFAHPGGEFEVHLRSKGRFWAPRFKCKSTWLLGSDAETLQVDFQQYGKYQFQTSADGFSGSSVGQPENWRRMTKKRAFSPAEVAVMDSKWKFEHAGGTFEVELRADAFNHFVCDAYPAHAHWRLDNADSPTPTIYINWGKYGEYELEVAADGSSAVGSAKGQPDKWRKMTNLGVLGSDLKQYAEHDH